MGKSHDDQDSGGAQKAFYLVMALIVAWVAYGPVNDWIQKARKYTTQQGLRNMRDAYTAYYSQKSAYPGPQLEELKLENGGTLAEWPVEPNSGSGSVVTSLTGTGGWFHDMEKHDVKVNLLGEDYFGQPYDKY